MAELAVIQNTLPDTLGELSKFVLIGRDKLQAVRAEISAIQKLGLAKEVYEQKKAEAQEIAETVTLAEMRTGELLRQIPKADNGGANQYRAKSTPVSNEQKPKSETIKELGFTQKQAERMQTLANNPEIVKEAIQEARDNDDIAKGGKKAVLFVASHTVDNPLEDIDAAACIVKQFYYKKHWYDGDGSDLKAYVNRFIGMVDGIAA